jgi:Fe-S-cluster containining protein
VTAAPPPRVRALSVHAAYRCRSSGACCSSGWEIGVEPELEARLRALRGEGPAGERGLVARPGLPHGARSRLAWDGAGRCAFLEPEGLCAVHRRLGEAALPSACRQFPRVSMRTPAGVSVTLSHYCPTAAGLLFSAVGLRVVEGPPAFPGCWPFEGLDAREALPPLLRPGVLMTWTAHERWEEHAVATFARLAPEAALARLTSQAERARAWTPADGDFDAFFAACHSAAGLSPETPGGSAACDPDPDGAAGAWSLVASTVPGAHRRPAPPPPVDAPTRALVEAGWPSLDAPLRAWLASKAFASWLALQGQGLRTTVLGLRVALGVARAEAGRGCRASGRRLDAGLLKEALRRADLLLLHLADPEALALRLSRCETDDVLGSTIRA